MLRNLVRSSMLAWSPCFLRTPRALLCTVGQQQQLQGKGKSTEDALLGQTQDAAAISRRGEEDGHEQIKITGQQQQQQLQGKGESVDDELSGQMQEAAAISRRGEEGEGNEQINGTGQYQQPQGKDKSTEDELSGQMQEVAAVGRNGKEDEGLKQTNKTGRGEKKDDIDTVKLEILMTSYEDILYKCYEHLARDAVQIRLPETRVVHTVLRSPHIDKKSREQFEMRTKKQLLIIKTNSRELPRKYFWLKRLRIIGAQYEVRVSCKTLLDVGRCKAILEKSRAGL